MCFFHWPGIFVNFSLHPGRLTRNIIMEVWKIIFLSKWVICRFHVNLPGCRRWWKVQSSPWILFCFLFPWKSLHDLKVEVETFNWTVFCTAARNFLEQTKGLSDFLAAQLWIFVESVGRARCLEHRRIELEMLFIKICAGWDSHKKQTCYTWFD